MLLTSFLKRGGFQKRGFFAIIHSETGRIYATTAVNIMEELQDLADALEAGKCRNKKLQRYYQASSEFTVLAKISEDGMRGAKKDLGKFRSTIEGYLFV